MSIFTTAKGLILILINLQNISDTWFNCMDMKWIISLFLILAAVLTANFNKLHYLSTFSYICLLKRCILIITRNAQFNVVISNLHSVVIYRQYIRTIDIFGLISFKKVCYYYNIEVVICFIKKIFWLFFRIIDALQTQVRTLYKYTYVIYDDQQ